MKKLFGILAIMAITFLGGAPAHASTITLSPTVVSVEKGQTFSLTIKADPAGQKLYTVKSVVSFPAALLESVSFTQAGGWVPLSVAGYDVVDNTNGTLTKTGGYTGGFSNPVTFGTAVFRAKESGIAVISVANTSTVYDAQNKNTLSGAQGEATVTILAAIQPAKNTEAQPPATEQSNSTSKQKSNTEESSVSTENTAEETPDVADEDTSASSEQNIAAAGAVKDIIPSWGWALIALVLAGGGLFIWKKYGKTNVS